MSRLLAIAVIAACGTDPVHHLPDAQCLQAIADYVVATTMPGSFACHDPFKLKIDLTNNSCAGVRIEDVKLSGVVTSGACTPPGATMFPPFTVAQSATSSIVDFTGGPFCCFKMNCPASFQCDEQYTITIDTPQGPITKTTTAHLSLDNCDVICPADAGP
jgi:hypothetical protein